MRDFLAGAALPHTGGLSVITASRCGSAGIYALIGASLAREPRDSP